MRETIVTFNDITKKKHEKPFKANNAKLFVGVEASLK